MKENQKRKLVISLGMTLSIALIILIVNEMKPQKLIDEPIQSSSSHIEDVTVDDESIVEVPMIDASDEIEEKSKADDKGTSQTIQSDTKLKEYTDEELTDKTKTPDGETTNFQEITQEQLNDKETKPTSSNLTNMGSPQPTNQGTLPGFSQEQIIQGGEGQHTSVDGGGDINKQVGIMG